MNAMTDVSAGTAHALTRRLAAPVDLLTLYSALSDDGRRPDTMLFETTAGASILMDRAAARITCRGPEVAVESLSAGGTAVLQIIERALGAVVIERAPDRLRLHFERRSDVDLQLKLVAPSPFDALRAILGSIRNQTPEEPFALCLAGIVAFDHVDLFEELPQPAADPIGFPDFIFWLAEAAIISEPGLLPRLVSTYFDGGNEGETRQSHFAAVERLADLGRCVEADFRNSPACAVPLQSPAEVAVDLDDDAFAETVARLKEHILAGDIYQIVPSRTFTAPCVDPLSAFARLRSIDRSPYMFFVKLTDSISFGASPETSVRVLSENGQATVEVKPIAGTRPRGRDRDEDDRMEADLRLDQKEVAEHMMLVDLARNDVARISEPGTRRVDRLMVVERYAKVMHLVSSVKGSLGRGLDTLHALAACLNVGTLSGAPKRKATELLRVYEPTRRGHYGGAIGWINGNGLMDMGVVIRSALVKDGIAHVRAGAGIVHDSDPAAEADESRRKASAILAAITGAGKGQ